MDFLANYMQFFTMVMLLNFSFYATIIMLFGPFFATNSVLVKWFVMPVAILFLAVLAFAQMGIGVAQIVLFVGLSWSYVIAPELMRIFRRRYPSRIV